MNTIASMTYHELIARMKEVKDELLNAEAMVLQLQAQEKAINARLQELRDKGHTLDVFITDHCLLRYLERYEGIATESYRKALARDLRKALNNMPGDSKLHGIKLRGMTFKMKGNAVTTVT